MVDGPFDYVTVRSALVKVTKVVSCRHFRHQTHHKRAFILMNQKAEIAHVRC
jgi:hypothetical protein